MTLGTLINIAVNVAVAAVNVVSAIATQGNNFIANAVNTVAGWFGGGSNSGSSSHSSGGSSSNRGGSSVISFEEQRRLAVQQRQQRQSLERDISYSLEQTEPEEEPPLDFADLLLPALVPAEIMLAAWGNPVAESMVIMLRNERGLFDAMMNAAASPEEGLRNLFAEAGRNEEWDRQALDLLMRFRGDEGSDNSGVAGFSPRSGAAGGFGLLGVSRGVVTRDVISTALSSFFQQGEDSENPYQITDLNVNPVIISTYQRGLVRDLIMTNEDYYMAAGERAFADLVERVLEMEGLDPATTPPEQIAEIFQRYNLPQSPEEFIAQAYATSAVINTTTWAEGRYNLGGDLASFLRTVEGAAYTLGFGAIRDFSAGPLELRPNEWTRLFAGARPASRNASLTEDAMDFIDPIPLESDWFAPNSVGQGLVQYLLTNPSNIRARELVAEALFPAYMSSTPDALPNATANYLRIPLNFLTGLWGSNPLGEPSNRNVSNPELIAEATASRYEAFLLMYINDLRNALGGVFTTEASDDLPGVSMVNDPNLYAMLQNAGGYIDNNPTGFDRGELDFHVSTQRALEYAAYLAHARGVFGSNDTSISPIYGLISGASSQ